MKTLFLLLLLATSALASATPIANNFVQIGGPENINSPTVNLPYSSIGFMKTIGAYAASGVTNTNGYISLVNFGSNSGPYQVASNAFNIMGLHYLTGAVGIGITVGYSTSSVVTQNGTGTPTGAVYFSGGSGVPSIASSVSSVWKFYPLTGTFPQNSYPFIQTNTGGYVYNVLIVGKDQ